MAATYGTLTDNGDTDVVLALGPVVFKATGTWDSGTITLYRMGGDGTFHALITESAITSDDSAEVLIDFPQNTRSKLKATLAGAGSPSIKWEFIGEVLTTS